STTGRSPPPRTSPATRRGTGSDDRSASAVRAAERLPTGCRRPTSPSHRTQRRSPRTQARRDGTSTLPAELREHLVRPRKRRTRLRVAVVEHQPVVVVVAAVRVRLGDRVVALEALVDAVAVRLDVVDQLRARQQAAVEDLEVEPVDVGPVDVFEPRLE